MFKFNKIQDRPAVKQDMLILDYLMRIDRDLARFSGFYMHMSSLQNPVSKSAQRQVLLEDLELITERSGGRVFSLNNDDVAVIFNKRFKEEILACLVKVRFMFGDDPFLKGAVDLESIGFVEFFDLPGALADFKYTIRQSVKEEAEVREPSVQKKSIEEAAPVVSPKKHAHRELTPEMLAKVQKTLSMTDFSSLIRRQSVCAVIGKSYPQPVFDEVYVSIADLRDMLLPDVDLTANPWLFQHLTETLDRRVLVNISQHDDGSLLRGFSLNLNVKTILSDQFLAFDENLSAATRSTIVLELQLVDILSDVKSYILAKNFAKYRGYKVCIDGVTLEKLKYINRQYMDSDFIKILWQQNFMDMVGQDKSFLENFSQEERAKIIICRVDDPQAVEVGNAFGIYLYQGRYIQKLAGRVPKKTTYVIRK